MTALRFLIDENLSPTLVEPARTRGFEAMHVNHLGLGTVADWNLLGVVAARDWVLVTNNAIEFRGRYRAIVSNGLETGPSIGAQSGPLLGRLVPVIHRRDPRAAECPSRG